MDSIEIKDILGYEGLYRITNSGQVISLIKGSNKVRATSITKDGYRIVTLSNKGKLKCFSVHRLIALHFIPNPESKKEVNHINGIKDDNRIENLEWVTPKENVRHAWETGLAANTIKAFSKCVKIINYKTGKIYNSIHELSDDLKMKEGSLRHHLIKRSLNYYNIMYLDDYSEEYIRELQSKNIIIHRVLDKTIIDKITELKSIGRTITEISKELGIARITVYKKLGLIK